MRKVPQNHQLLQKLSKEQQEAFEADAKQILNTGYWPWFQEDMELLTQRMMFKGTKEAQTFGTGMLYALDMMQKNITFMAYSKKPIKDAKEKVNMMRFRK